MSTGHTIKRLRADAALLGLPITEEAAELMLRHVELVYVANKMMNLTRIPLTDAETLHVLDSLAGLPQVLEAQPGNCADIGSGAGFPGITLAIASGRHFDLIESNRRKASFLERVVAELCLDVTVQGCRAEEAAIDAPDAYSCITARAVAKLPVLVELASPLLANGGRLLCWKGEPEEAELVRGRRAGAKTGMEETKLLPIVLPHTEARRSIVAYTKTGEPKVALPRRPGLAGTKPLA